MNKFIQCFMIVMQIATIVSLFWVYGTMTNIMYDNNDELIKGCGFVMGNE